MRKCIRCQTEMVEHYDLRVQGAGYGLALTGSAGLFARRLGKPRVAVCPNCGEISLYINPDRLNPEEEE